MTTSAARETSADARGTRRLKPWLGGGALCAIGTMFWLSALSQPGLPQPVAVATTEPSGPVHEPVIPKPVPPPPPALSMTQAAPRVPAPSRRSAPDETRAPELSLAWFQARKSQMPDDLAELKQRWTGESEDSEWTETTQREVTTLLEELQVAGELKETSCRMTVCKLKFELNSFEEALAFQSQVSGSYSNRSVSHAEIKDGRVIADVYIPRRTTP